MSKVKFIQWGTPTNPKTITQYNDDFGSVKEQYPGGVIFVTYTDDKNKQKQEIWANGVQYSVGGGGGNIIYGTTAPNAAGIVTVDGSQVTGADGYIYIYTTPDSQTAYYWKDSKWVAFEVDAEHIWFHEDITMAGDYTQVGNLTKDLHGTKSLKTELGKKSSDSFTLKDVMTQLLSQVVFPQLTENDYTYPQLTSSVTAPSISISGYSDHGFVSIDTTKTLTVSEVTANASNYNKTTPKAFKVIGLLHGYASDKNGTNASTDDYIEGKDYSTPTVRSTHTYELSYSKEGFSSSTSLPSDASNALASSCSIASFTVTPIAGKNKLSLTETGVGHTTTTSGVSSYYITSNTGTWDEKYKTKQYTSETLNSDQPSSVSTFTLWGVYPIYTNGVATSDDSKSDYSYSASVQAISNTSVYQLNTNKTSVSTKTFKLGFAAPASGSWVVYIPTAYNFTAKQYNSGSGKFDVVRSFTQAETNDKTGYNKYTFSDTNAGNGTVQFTLTTK